MRTPIQGAQRAYIAAWRAINGVIRSHASGSDPRHMAQLCRMRTDLERQIAANAHYIATVLYGIPSERMPLPSALMESYCKARTQIQTPAEVNPVMGGILSGILAGYRAGIAR